MKGKCKVFFSLFNERLVIKYEKIQQAVGGDLFRIETVEPYPLEHDLLVARAADEQDDDFRPELATHVENFEKYEYIFLGFPN